MTLAGASFAVAFFWVGPNIDVPSALVKSCELLGVTERIQLTDQSTPKVPGVTRVVRLNLPTDLMLARVMAYAQLECPGLVLYVDADSLLLQAELSGLGNRSEGTEPRLLIYPRQHDFLLNHNYPEYYPEFEDKMAKDVMPYLFGAMVGLNCSRIFLAIVENLVRLPPRFHRWFGDQVALAQVVQRGALERCIGLLPPGFMEITKSPLEPTQLDELICSNTPVLTFKGPSAKINLPTTLRNLQTLKTRM